MCLRGCFNSKFLAFKQFKMSQKIEPVTHCLFDMDGLLLDTEKIYTQITQRILERHGSKEIYSFDFKVTLMGLQSYDVAERVIKRYKLSITPDEYVRENRDLAADLMPKCELLPGAERLLRHLHAKNVPIALATSSSKEMFDMKTGTHSALFDLFHHRVYGSSDDEVVHGKPAPDIFLVAAKRFPDLPSPEKCLVFEDAPNGVKAACAAGMQSVMVPEDYVSEEFRQGATIVLKSLADFKPELFGLPAYDK